MAAPKDDPVRMKGTYSDNTLEFVAARVSEGINQLNETTLEFRTHNRDIDINNVVGSTITIEMDTERGETREFSGLCVGVEFLGWNGSLAHYLADLRPGLWFLTRGQDCRVFQNKSTLDIIQDVLTQYGVWEDVTKSLSDTYAEREYCVQYRESDLDFLHRLMEEEGIYYFVDHKGARPKITLADGPSAHSPVPSPKSIDYHAQDGQFYRHSTGIWALSQAAKAQTGKVMLKDYNFETPTAKLESKSEIETGDHAHKGREVYHYPGHFRETALGDKYARVLMEGHAAGYDTYFGAGNMDNIEPGKTFSILKHPIIADGTELMITRAAHMILCDLSKSSNPGAKSFLVDTDPALRALEVPYQVDFEVIPAKQQYRAPRTTSWPQINGVHTAVVTGPSGEEIYTDKYGRVKVQFHWDRKGKKDEKTSCWVRTMMPWTGKNWGMIALPRIGQEVVVQFEEGDPDRPLVIGMLYNADTMPPYALPANATQSGVKTNSSKGGSGFNELMFEDKKDAELVRFQAETDYQQIVKNDASITVGLEKKDKGDMDLTVHRNLTEKLKTGDHDFDVEAGKQTLHVKKDKTETIEGKSTLTVTKDMTTTVKEGNVEETVKKGNVTHTVDMGKETRTLKLGNYMVEAKAGKMTLKAMQKIELICGASKIEVTPASVKISSTMVQIDAKAMFQIKGALGQVNSQGPLIIKGLPTLIN